MDFALTDEQVELEAAVRSFLEDRMPEAEVRRLMETPTGYDEAAWEQFAGQLGLTGLAIPEEYGGAGYGFVELGVVATELGRALSGAPFLSSVVLAAQAIIASGDAAAMKDYLADIAAGELIAAIAVPAASSHWEPGDLGVSAVEHRGAWRLDGTVRGVAGGATASLLLIAAATASGTGLFAVQADAEGLDRTAESSIDMTRRLATVRLSQTPARLVGSMGDGPRILDETRAVGAAVLAAEQVGTAERCLELAVGYAKLREQFGVLIGTFQAVAHRCADMLVEVLTARYAALYALWAIDQRQPNWRVMASLARIRCTEAVNYAAAECLQVHGGNGYTWEFPVHLYFRRARASELLLGHPSLHRELMAELLDL